MTDSSPANNSSSANDVNPHYLDHVMHVSDSHGVEASEDIIAKNGMKLLAKGARINASVRERLLEHKLIKPLEQCMQVSDGVTGTQLLDMAQSLFDASPLLKLLYQSKPARQTALDAFRAMPLGAPVQSLLTVYHGSGPEKLRHGVNVALMALGMSLRLGPAARPQANATQMLQAGLCHDVGELYIEPSYLQAGVRLNPTQWKHVAAHPVVGSRVIKSLPGVHPIVADLVMDHHERLDGFGYPRGRRGADLTIDSQVLALSELLAGLMEAPTAPLMRAEVAVKLIPGEFHRLLIDLVGQVVGHCGTQELQAAQLPPFEETLVKVEAAFAGFRRIAAGRGQIDSEAAAATPAFQGLLEQSWTRLETIRKALSSTGLDAPDPDELQRRMRQLDVPADRLVHLEVTFILREIGWRLRELERELTSRTERVAPADLPRLFKLLALIAPQGARGDEAPAALAETEPAQVADA